MRNSVRSFMSLPLCLSFLLVSTTVADEPTKQVSLAQRLAEVTAEVAALDESIPHSDEPMMDWRSLPDLPDSLGVAGPFVGVQIDKEDPAGDVLIVAGGANFPTGEGENLWDVAKVWHDRAYVLTREKDAKSETGWKYTWLDGLTLDRPVAYGASVSTDKGVVCIGGCDSVVDEATGERQQISLGQCFLLRFDVNNKELLQVPLPSLPSPCAFMDAALLGRYVYVAGGQSGGKLDSAMKNFWRLDLSKLDAAKGLPDDAKWETLPAWPGPSRVLNITAAQHNGFNDCIYVISGRRQREGTQGDAGIELLSDVYEFNPVGYDPALYDDSDEYAGPSPWRRRADAPHTIMAGPAAAVGQSHIFALGGTDGALIPLAGELKDDHPGFRKKVMAYHTITDTWIDAGPSPANHVTTPAVKWRGDIVVASGEVRPRVRSRAVWSIRPIPAQKSFGAVNFTVLFAYLLAMVGVGVYFARKNKNTDDYFRGGKKVVWWAAGCSIFATMLSSITFMSIPAKAYAQDIVYLIGNFMILAVAPIAVFIALPFFRRIDATSAYEYLEKRFNRGVRLIASGLFTLFHLFRMGIVMSLAALALATVADFTTLFGWFGQSAYANAAICVLIMGILSIIYCTMGGVEAVIWTDTLQTVVLLGGALLCFIMLVVSAGGPADFYETSVAAEKLRVVNWTLDPTSASLAIWVVLIGAIGQNISSYTSDQAVVQRYMTTPTRKRAASAIWTAAILSVPASILFFLLGTALFVFYSSNPEKLDPTFTTDQIFPLFIATEVPIGVAGLIVAGIFAAAQSTISTSMNSTATAVVTDFIRPLGAKRTEASYLRTARGLTLSFGLVGTMLGLLFINPDIKSLFEVFIKVIGLFMGVLGGLFALGMLTRRASGVGAMIGAVVGATIMGAMPFFTKINGYLYAAIGITSCFVVGYVISLVIPAQKDSIEGLTIFDRIEDTES